MLIIEILDCDCVSRLNLSSITQQVIYILLAALSLQMPASPLAFGVQTTRTSLP